MNQTEIERTEGIAPIFREMYAERPDYRAIALALLQICGVPELGQVLQQRRQDWESIALCLLEGEKLNPLYRRCNAIIEAIRKHPGATAEAIATIAGYSETTVRQTVNALHFGGLPIERLPGSRDAGRIGRPKTINQIKRPKNPRFG